MIESEKLLKIKRYLVTSNLENAEEIIDFWLVNGAELIEELMEFRRVKITGDN